MTPDTWKLIASIGGLVLTFVTAPFLWAIRAESGRIRAEMTLLAKEAELKRAEMEGRLNVKMADMQKDLLAAETRLNERIDTRLVHR
jgi:hypothetical protein